VENQIEYYMDTGVVPDSYIKRKEEQDDEQGETGTGDIKEGRGGARTKTSPFSDIIYVNPEGTERTITDTVVDTSTDTGRIVGGEGRFNTALEARKKQSIIVNLLKVR